MTLLKKLTSLAGIAAVLLVVGAPAAFADIVFTTSGTSSTLAVSGTADFAFSGSTLTLTLTNTSNVGAVAQVLDGLAFDLPGVTSLTLTNVDATNGFEHCTGSGASTTCASDPTFNTYKIVKGKPVAVPGTSPYGWGISGSFLLAAGNGSFKPAGILGSSLTPGDGLGDNPHNDYLNGPVIFTFDMVGTPGTLSNVVFDWGTVPGTSDGVRVPDGGTTVLLLGLALTGVGVVSRRLV